MNPAFGSQLSRLRKLKRMFQRGTRQADEQFPLTGLTTVEIEKLTLREREIWDRMIPLLYPIALRKASQLIRDKRQADALGKG